MAGTHQTREHYAEGVGLCQTGVPERLWLCVRLLLLQQARAEDGCLQLPFLVSAVQYKVDPVTARFHKLAFATSVCMRLYLSKLKVGCMESFTLQDQIDMPYRGIEPAGSKADEFAVPSQQHMQAGTHRQKP